jgi:hypothetical protein
VIADRAKWFAITMHKHSTTARTGRRLPFQTDATLSLGRNSDAWSGPSGAIRANRLRGIGKPALFGWRSVILRPFGKPLL